MGTALAIARHDAAWWSTYVPALVVDAFDSCATTGVGPDDAMARRASSILIDSLDHLSRTEEPDENGFDTNDDVGCPSLGLMLFLRQRYGWAMPSGEALDAIAREHAGERVVEIGAGSGYVAACLRARGLDVEAVCAPVAECHWAKWWGRSFVADATRALASGLDYRARAYVMLMPDRRGAGEDMMLEALTRMPVGATLYLYAPRHAAGSDAGRELLAASFREVGTLPMLDVVPHDPEDDHEGRAMTRYERVAG